jgi:hypothetical protein
MQRLQAFKYELMPDGGQRRDMRRFAGSCRFVFNGRCQRRCRIFSFVFVCDLAFSNGWICPG